MIEKPLLKRATPPQLHMAVVLAGAKNVFLRSATSFTQPPLFFWKISTLKAPVLCLQCHTP